MCQVHLPLVYSLPIVLKQYGTFVVLEHDVVSHRILAPWGNCETISPVASHCPGGWAEKVMAIKTIYGLPIFLVVQESINRHHNKLVLPHFADCCIACWLAVQVLPRWSSWYSASIESMYSVLYLCWVTSYHRCDSSCLGGQQMPHWPTTWLTLYCPPQVSVADSWSLKDTLLCIITNFL
jgi:hypothetical protein